MSLEFAFTLGRATDVRGFDMLAVELPPESELFMDSGYTDYAEGLVEPINDLWLSPRRRRDVTLSVRAEMKR